jgi:hypothetical protein
MSRPPVSKHRMPEPEPLFPRWVTITVVLVVLSVWVASVVYSTTNPDWPVPATIHGAVILVIGAVLGVGVVKK